MVNLNMKSISHGYLGVSLWPIFFLGLVTFLFSILIGLLSPEHFSSFLSLLNLKTIAVQSVIIGIAALGMTMVMSIGGIDLSAGSTISFSSVLVALVLSHGWTRYGGTTLVSTFDILLGIAVVSTTTFFIGYTTGWLTIRFKMAPIIVTLGMMQVIRGASKWLAGQEMVRTPDNALQHWMDPVPQWTGIFFAPGVWLALILCVMLGRVLKVSVWGRFLYAMGGNRKTAAACGVDVSQMTKTVYGVAGTLFGIAGIMQYASLGSGSPSEAVGLELDIIAAVVIGGGTLGGGRGSATGAMMGAVTMSVLRSGCAMLGVPSFVQEIMIGLVIIAAIGGDQLKRRVWADHQSS